MALNQLQKKKGTTAKLSHQIPNPESDLTFSRAEDHTQSSFKLNSHILTEYSFKEMKPKEHFTDPFTYERLISQLVYSVA